MGVHVRVARSHGARGALGPRSPAGEIEDERVIDPTPARRGELALSGWCGDDRAWRRERKPRAIPSAQAHGREDLRRSRGEARDGDESGEHIYDVGGWSPLVELRGALQGFVDS